MENNKRKKQTTENFIKDVRRKTRRVFSSEQKIQIVMEAMRAELSVAEICRKYSIADAQFYKWNKEFLEAGKKRLAGDTTREATSDEVAELRKENQRLKEIVADLVLRYDIVKSTCSEEEHQLNRRTEFKVISTGNDKVKVTNTSTDSFK
jgi:transposase